MPRYKQLVVTCSCGLPLAIYYKGGKGRLRKMYFGRIKEDLCGVLLTQKGQPNGTEILCPNCQKRIGTVAMVLGHAAIKVNQGLIRE